MGFIVGLVASILCFIVYNKMYKREQPAPMGKKNAFIPVGMGVLAPVLSTIAALLLAFAVSQATNGSVQELPVAMRSFISSFILAGFTEEFIKFLLLLLAVKIVKPKNVYEYGILGAGIGFGFTGLEDAIYGDGSVAIAISRIPTFALHMAFGVIMGVHFGLAKYEMQNNSGETRKHMILSLVIPVLWHTIYDAATASNFALQAEEENTQIAGVMIALVVIIVSIILQFAVLRKIKKRCGEFCEKKTENG